MPEKNLFETALESLPSEDHRMRTWLALNGCFTTVERSLRRRFSHVFRSSLPRYDVLTALAQFPDGQTMGQLAAKLMVSKGNITGVVRRLQEHCYVRQVTSNTDRRVQVVTLTAKGRELWDAMHAEYRSVINELLASVEAADAKALTASLLKTEEGIRVALKRAED